LLYAYLLFCIPYHLLNLEQNQLFLFNSDFIWGFFSKPGAIDFIPGEFITQFFISPWLAALFVTMLAATAFFILRFIFRRHGMNGIVFPMVPVIFMIALQSTYNYTINYHVGWIIATGFFAGYISIRNSAIRLVYGLLTGAALYFLIGGYFIVAMGLSIVHELFYRNESYRFYHVTAYLVLIGLVPFLSWKYLFFMNIKEAWVFPVPLGILSQGDIFVILLLLYLPVVLFTGFMYKKFAKKDLSFRWSAKFILIGGIILIAVTGLAYKFAYDKKKEAFLEIDYCVQQSQWERVLTLSKKYPGYNQVVMYYTNLALYKTGRLANEMFSYKQSGTAGLWLEWKRNESAPLYGGEVFYQMAYTSEAFRWAFEAMEVKGPSPRLLKRLTITSLAHYKYSLAGKYLSILDQSLFYRNWAKHYQECLNDTSLILKDNELSEKRHFVPANDFISDITTNDIGFTQLLNNHPDNRMAFEYMMASYLLNKNLKAFAANIYRLKELGYDRIPTHYEEALIFYMALTKQNCLPEGYSIGVETKQHFHNYAELFAQFRNSQEFAAQQLYPQYGNTFWFHMQFGKI
jgi:hypothetical protein